MTEKHQPAEGFFYQPKTIQWILRVFYAGCVLLLIADFIVHRHIITEVESVPAFYALYGFVACVILVIIAAQMRKLLMRDENYYTQHEEPLSSSHIGQNDQQVQKDASDV